MNLLRHLVFVFFVVAFLTGADSARAQTDSLPSRNDGASKTAIVEFVALVTREGGPDFALVDQRIARASWVSCTTLMPCANTPMTGNRR